MIVNKIENDKYKVDTGFGESSIVIIHKTNNNYISFWDDFYTTKCSNHNSQNQCHHENCKFVRMVFQATKLNTHPSIYWTKDLSSEYWNEKTYMINEINKITQEKSNILDVGTWFHQYRELFNSNNIFGIDTYVDAVSVANYMHNSKNYKNSSMEELSFDDDFFDAICSFEVVEHVPSKVLSSFIKSSYEKLKMGGVFMISTPNGYYYPDFICDPTHKIEFKYNNFISLVEKYGFKLEEAKGFGLINHGLLNKIIRKVMRKLNIKEFPINFLNSSRTILYRFKKVNNI